MLSFTKGFLVGICALSLVSVLGGCARRVESSVQGALPGAQGGSVRNGLEVLASRRFDLLQGKRVGLVTNQTGVDRRGTPARVLIQKAPGVHLDRLFVPEHGLDGREGAGRKVNSRVDRVTGLAAYSLYGATRKPSAAMLHGLDMLIFDLQDIGARSYTYISTMILCMEACGEQGVDFVVLDRPNPLGGLRVEGPPLERRWQSFVGQIPVPYVHGMTAGELARMAHGERWIKRRPRLHVVSMQGWSRDQFWRDTGYRWIRTSPNVPHASTAWGYVATGMLGGTANVDIGIGTNSPFAYAGGKGINGYQLARNLSKYGFRGVRFRPYSRNGFGGVRLEIDPRTPDSLPFLDVCLIYEINRLAGGRVISGMTSAKRDLFNKVYGSSSLYDSLRAGRTPVQIAAGWKLGEARFRVDRIRYLLYP